MDTSFRSIISNFKLAILISIIIITKSDLISPTTSNTTGDFYIVSEAGSNFQSDVINCTVSYCHIICDDSTLSCYGLTVYASSADVLIVECDTYRSCQTATINGALQETYVYCKSEDSCSAAVSGSDHTPTVINVNNTDNVYIDCDYGGGSSSSDSACTELEINGSNAGNVEIICNSYDCYQSILHFDNAETVNISLTGSYAIAETILYGANITNKLMVDCSQTYACEYADIYCPFYGECIVNCSGLYACHDTQLYIEYKRYDKLDLYCNDRNDTACDSLDINCVLSGLSSALSFVNASNQWMCDDVDCCAFNYEYSPLNTSTTTPMTTPMSSVESSSVTYFMNNSTQSVTSNGKNNNNNSGLSDGIIAVIVVCSVVGLVLIGITSYFVYRKYNENSNVNNDSKETEMAATDENNEGNALQNTNQTR